MSTSQKIRVLVAPLDWGLGHTTRCIPIVNELITQGAEVLIAGNKIQQQILSPLFPDIEFLTLSGYNVRYSRSRTGFFWTILAQLPRIGKAVMREHRWLKKITAAYQLDAVISDNRYGLHHDRIPTVLITHQLQIQQPAGRRMNNWLRRFNYRQLQKFSRCWIPDVKDSANLGGILSHPDRLPLVPCWYLGPISRLTPGPATRKPGHLLFVISGPEPQRTRLEQLVFRQLADYPGTATVVLGRPEKGSYSHSPGVEVFGHLAPEVLNAQFNRADYIICRSGYSSVMDINAVQARSIMIPTPGQSEQEYLATYLNGRGFAIGCSQPAFHLATMLKRAADFAYRGYIQPSPDLLQQAVQDLLRDIKKAGGKPA